MTKKKIAGLIVTFIIVMGIVIAFFISQNRLFSPKKVEPPSETTVTREEPTVELVTWDDPAGFSFQYPKNLKVDTHDEDTTNYAHVELTSSDHKGSSIIWAKDTTVSTIAQWLKNENTMKDATSIDTTLGGNEAKKVILKEPTKKQITAALDEDIVVMVETDLADEAYWQSVNDIILKNFSFSTTKTNDSGEAQGSGEPAVAADEETSIE